MNITIKKQRRRSMALQLTPKGILILIPNNLNEDDKQVQLFIERSLQNLPEPPQQLEQSHAPETVYDLVEQWVDRIGVDIQRTQIREMTTKWGSISTAGYLTLADDLLWLPIKLVEYVIVHELMHLKFPNHAKGWQVSMGMYLPDWRERERQLQAYALVQPTNNTEAV